MNISAKVDDSQLQDMTRIALLMFRPARINRLMAQAGSALTKRHLAELSAARGKFYGNFARGVYAEADASRANVVIPPAFGSQSATQRGNPLAAHYYGRTFTQADLFGTNPKTGKTVQNFVIPTAAARGTRPGDYGDALQPVFGKAGIVGLALRGAIPATFTRKRQSGLAKAVKAARQKNLNPLLFIFVKGFKLKGGDGVGDKTVLPTGDEYALTAMLRIKGEVEAGLQQRGLA